MRQIDTLPPGVSGKVGRPRFQWHVWGVKRDGTSWLVDHDRPREAAQSIAMLCRGQRNGVQFQALPDGEAPVWIEHVEEEEQ